MQRKTERENGKKIRRRKIEHEENTRTERE
jgi:hypothetical protein